MSLLADGSNYFLQPNGGRGGRAELWRGAGRGRRICSVWLDAPIAAAQTASGYEVAWKITGGDQYQIWFTDSSGNETLNPLHRVGRPGRNRTRPVSTMI